MTLLNFRKLPVKKNYNKYLIRWDEGSASKSQLFVKQFLKQFWQYHIVYEELPVLGTKLRMDFYNATKRISVEYDGAQHNKFTPFFHGSKAGFLSSLKRDDRKTQFCEINNITQIVLIEEDLSKLSSSYIYDKFGVDIK
ncbi:MAG: hypothetical protein EKK57_00355 [Proteobacteria bacterium]|nr:MAG: hypothetical protein EKK57_00355 [Pseudomonadota bacterium]